MTPESTALARELVEDAIFAADERRTELLRQAEDGRGPPDALRGEAGRLSGRIDALRALDEELQNPSNVRPSNPAGEDVFS